MGHSCLLVVLVVTAATLVSCNGRQPRPSGSMQHSRPPPSGHMRPTPSMDHIRPTRSMDHMYSMETRSPHPSRVQSTPPKSREGGDRDMRKRPDMKEKADKFIDTLKKKDRKEIKDHLRTASSSEVKYLAKKLRDKGNEKDVKEIFENMNCSQKLHFMNGTGKWDCSLIRSIRSPLEKCRTFAKRMPDMVKEMIDVPLARCGLLSPKKISKDTLKKIGKDLPKDVKKKIAKNLKETFGNPDKWTIDDIPDVKDFLPEMPEKELLKIKVDVLRNATYRGYLSGLDKKRKAAVFRKIQPRGRLTADDISRLCDAKFESQIRPSHIKDIAKEDLKKIGKCFSSKSIPENARREYLKKLELPKKGPLNKEQVKSICPAMRDVKPSLFKSGNNTKLFLKECLNQTKKQDLQPWQKRSLAKELYDKHGSLDQWSDDLKKKARSLIPYLPKAARAKLSEKDVVDIVKRSKKSGKKSLEREMCDYVKRNNSAEMRKIRGLCINVFSQKELKNFTAKDLGFGDGDDDTDDDDSLEEGDKDGYCERDDNDDDDDDDNTDEEEVEDDVKFCSPHSAFAVIKLAGPPENYTRRIVRKAVKILIHQGSRKSDIKKIRNDSLRFVSELFSKRAKVLTLSQVDLLAKRIKAVVQVNKSDSDFFEDMGELIVLLGVKDLMSVPANASETVVEQIRKSDFGWRLADRLKTALANTTLKLLNIKDMSKVDGDSLDKLGHLICWLPRKQFDAIPDGTFNERLSNLRDNIEEFAGHKSFKKCAKWIVQKVIQAKGGASNLTEGDVDEIGEKVIEKGLSPSDAEELSADVAEKMREGKMDFEDPEVSRKLFVNATVTGRRRRREVTDYSTKDADYFLNMGNSIIGLPATGIAAINRDVFGDIVAQISGLSGWTKEQLTEWAKKAKEAWGTVETFTDGELLQLGNFAKGFAAADIYKMNLTNTEVIQSLGAVTGYTSEQVTRGFEKIKSIKPVNQMSGVDLLALGSFALGMTPEDIGAITRDGFEEVVATFGAMSNGQWTTAQLTKLRDRAVEIFGATNTWDGATLSSVGKIIGGFTDAEMAALDGEDLQYISSSTLASVPPSKFKLLKEDVLKQLDAEQAASVTADQRSQLSESQRNALDTAVIRGLLDSVINESGSETGTDPPVTQVTQKTTLKSGSMKSASGFFSFLVPLLAVRALFF